MSTTFRAVVVDRRGDENVPRFQTLEPDALPEDGDLTVAVTHTALNYSDAATAFDHWGSIDHVPHVPGIDFVGRVERSDHRDYAPGDRVLHTSYGVGYVRHGGWAERAVTKAEWAVPLGDTDLSDAELMGLGTVGLTAMLAVDELEARGMKPDQGPVLVTAAAGGVGTLAILLLKRLGYEVVASCGEKDYELVRTLGADEVADRHDLDEETDAPMEDERWAGVIDAVGGNALTRAVKQLKYGATAAACGLVGGTELGLQVVPFLMRNVGLVGINSVHTPRDKRLAAWRRLLELIDREGLAKTMSVRPFDEVIDLARAKLDGEGPSGRIVLHVANP